MSESVRERKCGCVGARVCMCVCACACIVRDRERERERREGNACVKKVPFPPIPPRSQLPREICGRARPSRQCEGLPCGGMDVLVPGCGWSGGPE